MRTGTFLTAGLLLLTAAGRAAAQAGKLPELDKNPTLRVEAGGPTSFVTALAFSPDGRTLYTAGWDKVVRVWRLDAREKNWESAPAFRVPLQPGSDGRINAIVTSPDGKWLAVGGSAAVRGRAGFRQT